jgi:hypothetical protein
MLKHILKYYFLDKTRQLICFSIETAKHYVLTRSQYEMFNFKISCQVSKEFNNRNMLVCFFFKIKKHESTFYVFCFTKIRYLAYLRNKTV